MDSEPRMPETVVKVGGGLFPHPDLLDAVLGIIAGSARHRPLLVVPGGGPFADAVRDIDSRLGLSDEASHWMAVLAMDQSAYALAGRVGDARVVTSTREIAAAAGQGRVPVLAPFHWMRQSDPLPHTWDVTSDSIAAWVAREVGARALVLIKPPGVPPGSGSVDPYFVRAVGDGLVWRIVPADRFDASCLHAGHGMGR